MATVPSYDHWIASPSAAPLPYANPGDAPSAGAIGARQTQEMGAAMQSAGADVVRIATEMQRQADLVRVNDAMNQARQAALDLAYDPKTGYLNLKGNAALQRPDGQPLPEEYGGKLRNRLQQIGQALGNDVQRREFVAQASNLATTFSGQVQQHMLQEFKAHAVSVQDGTIALGSDEAKRNWSSPETIAPALQRVEAAVVEKGRTLGWSASEIAAARLLTTSKVHKDVVLEALANGNPAYASSYLEARRSQMTADDILSVQGHVNQQTWAQMAQQAVQQATDKAMPALAPSGFDRMVQITAQTESGGRDFGPDGKILTSPKGAKGRMQVLDSTLANPGLPGVQALDPKTATPDQRARFGQQYLQALMQRYGDPARAWAAYNAGPGAVDKAVADAKKDAESGNWAPGVLPSDWWLQQLPKETQAYVSKNMQALASGGGFAPRPTELDFVNAAIGALPPGSPPAVVETTRRHAQEQFGVITKSMDQAADAAVLNVQRWIAANPGALTIDKVPPQMVDAVRQLAPAKLDDLMRYAQAVNNPDVSTNLTVYNRLAANPELLRRLPDSEFEMLRGQLSREDFKHFSNERARLVNPTGANDPGNADTSAINTAVNDHLRALKIDPTPKDDGGNDAARVGAIRKFVTDSVLRAQAMAGKKFTDAEVRDSVGRLFLEQGTLSHWYRSDQSQQLLTMQAGDIPGDVRKAIKADFAKLGVSAPTDAQVLGAYWTAVQQSRKLNPQAGR